jgi:hypothetical protein
VVPRWAKTPLFNPSGLHISARSTLETLLEPLFIQSQKMNSPKFATSKQEQRYPKDTPFGDARSSEQCHHTRCVGVNRREER